MKQNEEAISKLRKLVSEQKNGFAECRTPAEFGTVERELRNHPVPLLPFPQSFPCLIRLGCGKPKEVILYEEYKGLTIYPKISGLVTGELQEGHSWKYYSSLNEDDAPDYSTKALKAEWHQFHDEKDECPFDVCFGCGKQFEDDEIPYAGLFTETIGYRMRCICKKCAYQISEKVTDYEITSDGELRVKEWTKGSKHSGKEK